MKLSSNQYERYFCSGTTNGHTNSSNNFTYQFHGDPRATFAQFFGSSNPFGSFFDMSDNLFEKNVFDSLDTETDFFSPFGGLGGQRHGLGGAFRSHSFNVHSPLKKEKQQDPPIEHDLYATLEEINKGCVKKMKISRRVIQADGSPKKEDKYVSIAIKPGWKSGTKVTFQKEGDQTRGKIPADIVFLIRDKPHPLFKREGSDLRYTARLTLKQVNETFGCFACKSYVFVCLVILTHRIPFLIEAFRSFGCNKWFFKCPSLGFFVSP